MYGSEDEIGIDKLSGKTRKNGPRKGRTYGSLPYASASTANSVCVFHFLHREVRPDDLRAAFCIVDPGLPDQILDLYLSHVFQASKEQLDSAVSLPAEIVMQRLASLELKRQGAVPGDAKGALPVAEETESI